MMDFTFSLSALLMFLSFSMPDPPSLPPFWEEVCSYIHYLLPFWLSPIFEDCQLLGKGSTGGFGNPGERRRAVLASLGSLCPGCVPGHNFQDSKCEWFFLKITSRAALSS